MFHVLESLDVLLWFHLLRNYPWISLTFGYVGWPNAGGRDSLNNTDRPTYIYTQTFLVRLFIFRSPKQSRVELSWGNDTRMRVHDTFYFLGCAPTFRIDYSNCVSLRRLVLLVLPFLTPRLIFTYVTILPADDGKSAVLLLTKQNVRTYIPLP